MRSKQPNCLHKNTNIRSDQFGSIQEKTMNLSGHLQHHSRIRSLKYNKYRYKLPFQTVLVDCMTVKQFTYCSILIHIQKYQRGQLIQNLEHIVRLSFPFKNKPNGLRSRRSLVGSVLAGFEPQAGHKKKYKRYFFGDFPSADFWQKL